MGGELVGMVNRYDCETCGGIIHTVNVVEGTTPFTIGCRATEGCEGYMRSAFYRVLQLEMLAGWEWYMPTAEEIEASIDAAVAKRLAAPLPKGCTPEDWPDERIREVTADSIRQYHADGALALRQRSRPSERRTNALKRAANDRPPRHRLAGRRFA